MNDISSSIEDIDITQVIRELEALDYEDNFGDLYDELDNLWEDM